MSEQQIFKKGQIVLVKKINTQQMIPCQIVKLSSIGIYKIRIIGVKETYQYVNEHNIQILDVDKVKLDKLDKKMKKIMKIALKKHQKFQYIPHNDYQNLEPCHFKEQQQESHLLIQNDEQQKPIVQGKIQVISNYSIQQLKNDIKNGSLSIIKYNTDNEKIIEKEYNPKSLLMNKLQWALQQYILGIQTQESEDIIRNIIDSQIFQPKKIYQILEGRIVEKKFKNYLKQKSKQIFTGGEAYYSNFHIFDQIQKDINSISK